MQTSLSNSYKCLAVAEMGDRLATIDVGQKLEGMCPFGEEELGPHLTQCGVGQGLPSYQGGILIHPAVCPQQTYLAENWGLCPFLGEGRWVHI